jgi:hypothetical protein
MASQVRYRNAVALLMLASTGTALTAAPRPIQPDADFYLKPHPVAGQSISDITYRVISLYGPGIEDSVVQTPATGTCTFLASDSPDIFRWSIDLRMDGKLVLKAAEGDYRDGGTTMCFKGKCNFTTDASGPFFNPTFWGAPHGPLTAGQTWTVALKEPWELGPPGAQTVTVVSVDKVNGIAILKREGEGVGPYEGNHDSLLIKRDGKSYKVAAKYGNAHWVGQAVFQHGVVVSDELLCNTPVEITSPEIGTLQIQERQYMSVLQHPDPIAS